MFSNLKIYVQGFAWNGNEIGKEYYRMSFMNTADPYIPATERTDITPYIIQDSRKSVV